MKQLMFKSRFIPLIQSGSKKQTIRLKCRVKQGDLVQARCRYDQPAFGILRVLSVRALRRADLSEIDAKADGFQSLSELQGTLTRLYPQLRAESELFCIRFEYMDNPEQIRAALAQQDSLTLFEP